MLTQFNSPAHRRSHITQDVTQTDIFEEVSARFRTGFKPFLEQNAEAALKQALKDEFGQTKGGRLTEDSTFFRRALGKTVGSAGIKENPLLALAFEGISRN